MTTTLAVKQPLKTAITPPPRKHEVAAAMLQRARQQHAEARALRDEKASKLLKRIESLALKESKKQKPEPKFTLSAYCSRVDVEYRVTSPELEALISEYTALNRSQPFDEKAIKEAIRESLDTTRDRVAFLLTDKASSALIDQMLGDAIGSPSAAVINV